jgi:membrane protease YdiL (CAAX protease family)
MPSLVDRIRTVVWAGFLALLISGLAGGIWSALIIGNLTTTPTIPWSVAAMALVLWLGWQYLGGRWWPRSTAAARRRDHRANPVPIRAFLWALLAGALSIVALAGYWIVAFQLVKMPGNAVTPLASPDLAAYPPLVVALGIAMGSLVSPLSEEAGFRGYCLVILERRFSAPAAIAISSVFFALGHVSVAGLWLPKLFVYFLVGVAFAAIADLTNSILPSIPVHVLGDLTFFTLVWPYDATRSVVWGNGTDAWFWIHATQAVVFTVLAILAFRRLAQVVSTRGLELGVVPRRMLY